MKTALLVGIAALSIATAHADTIEIPNYDVLAYCKNNSSMSLKNCVEFEYMNRSLVVNRWKILSPSIKTECIKAADESGKTYDTLASCAMGHAE
jgi:hypothetical protein